MSTEQSFPRTTATTVRRHPERAHYDRALAYAILDEGLCCSVGFLSEGRPCVIPMTYARHGDKVVLHGASKSRISEALAAQESICVTVTLLDAIVFARSAMHHSMNYRSVMVFGKCTVLSEPEQKMEALKCLVEHVAKGRWNRVRTPSTAELRATQVFAIPIDTASVKCRAGGPIEDPSDLMAQCWAGIVPLELTAGEPVGDPMHPPAVAPDASLLEYRRIPSRSANGESRQ